MKNLIKYSIVALAFCLIGNVYGQTPPNNVTIDSKAYYQHGYNSSGGPNLPQEERDSVTVTSVIKYFVLPDPTANPGYNPANTLDFANVKSSFAWSLKNSLGTTNSSTTPVIAVTWNNIGIDSVKVRETPSTGCIGSGTSIPVAVIKIPEIAFSIKNSKYADSACYSQIDASTKYQFAMTVSAESPQVLVDYTVTKDGLPYSSLNDTNVKVVGGNITLSFTEYGRYEVTITKVSDRVLRKTNESGNSILGIITPAGAKFAYHVMRPVQTGPIYRLPNNY